MSTFSDPQAVARYAEAPLRQVPGFLALQQMSRLLLAEHVPAQGRVLVLGAGGGLELKAFAEAQPGWQLLGVDPAAPMLALAKQTLGPLNARVELLEGYIDDAPDLRFDGASCLLTLHFLDAAQLARCASCTGACSPAHRWWWRTTACRRIRPASCAGCSATPRSPKPPALPTPMHGARSTPLPSGCRCWPRAGSGAAAGGRLRRCGAVLCRLQLQGWVACAG